MYAISGGEQESLGEKTGGRQTEQQKKKGGENVFFTSRLTEAANGIVQSKKMGNEEKIRQLAKLYVEAKSGEDKKFIADALLGQIEFLSNKSSLNATRKIEILLELPGEISENKPLLDAVAKAYTDQTKYLKDKANNVLDATFFAQMQIASPLGEPLLGLIKEEVWLSEHDAGWYKQYVKKGTGQELDPGKIPNNIVQCAKDYYESQILAADKLLAQQKKRNPPNGTILDLLEGIKSNAKEHIGELQSIGKTLSPDEKLEMVKGLIKFNHNHLQAAMQKIGEENHWDQLYSAQGDSKFMKFLVYNTRHAKTGQLWCAFALSCLNPLAGQVAFGIMGSKEMAEGISTRNYSQIFFGLSMIIGMSKNPMAGGVAGSYMNASIFKGMYDQIASGLNTGFTPTDMESLGNNLVLLAGFYKARMEQGGKTRNRDITKNETTKIEKKDVGNTKPERQKPKDADSKGLDKKTTQKLEENPKEKNSSEVYPLEVSNEINLRVKNLEKNGITFRPEELSLILKDPRVENILASKNFTPQDVGRVTESLLRIAKDSPELLEASVNAIESYAKLDSNFKYSLTNFLADPTSPLKAKLDFLADPKIFEQLSKMGEKSWEAFVSLSGIWDYTFEMMPKTENGRVLAQKNAREIIDGVLAGKTAEEVLRAVEQWSAKQFIERGDYPKSFKSAGDAEAFLLKKYESMVVKLADRKTELQSELADRQVELQNETDISKKTELEKQVAQTQKALEIVKEFEKNPGAFRNRFMDELNALNSAQTQVQKDALRMISNVFKGTYQADLLSKLSPIGLVVPEQFFTIYSKVSRGNAEGCAFLGKNLFLVEKNLSPEKMTGTALHEAYHSLADLNGGGKVVIEPFMKIGDKQVISKPEIVTHLNEGLTDYFAMQTALKNGLEYEPGYSVEIKTAFYLENVVGKEALLRAYLTSDFTDVARRFDQVLGEGQFQKFISEKDGVNAAIYLDKMTVKEYAMEHPGEKVAWHEFSIEKMKERSREFGPVKTSRSKQNSWSEFMKDKRVEVSVDAGRTQETLDLVAKKLKITPQELESAIMEWARRLNINENGLQNFSIGLDIGGVNKVYPLEYKGSIIGLIKPAKLLEGEGVCLPVYDAAGFSQGYSFEISGKLALVEFVPGRNLENLRNYKKYYDKKMKQTFPKEASEPMLVLVDPKTGDAGLVPFKGFEKEFAHEYGRQAYMHFLLAIHDSHLGNFRIYAEKNGGSASLKLVRIDMEGATIGEFHPQDLEKMNLVPRSGSYLRDFNNPTTLNNGGWITALLEKPEMREAFMRGFEEQAKYISENREKVVSAYLPKENVFHNLGFIRSEGNAPTSTFYERIEMPWKEAYDKMFAAPSNF